MVALATVLSLFKLVEMPYGGSVTFASMLPIIVLSYRHGVGMGLAGGVTFAIIQQLLGLKYLSYFTTWQSILALIFLDYILAFALVGLAGIWRRVTRRESTALILGGLTAAVIRYACHVIAGATVWAGLSIPDSAALIYSLGYNATYMIPETLVLLLVTYYLGEHIDLRGTEPKRRIPDSVAGSPGLLLPVTVLVLGVIADVALIAPSLQDAETGMLTLAGLADVPWLSVAIVSAICVAISVFLYARAKKKADRAE